MTFHQKLDTQAVAVIAARVIRALVIVAADVYIAIRADQGMRAQAELGQKVTGVDRLRVENELAHAVHDYLLRRLAISACFEWVVDNHHKKKPAEGGLIST
jgi:hypothetical protein